MFQFRSSLNIYLTLINRKLELRTLYEYQKKPNEGILLKLNKKQFRYAHEYIEDNYMLQFDFTDFTSDYVIVALSEDNTFKKQIDGEIDQSNQSICLK
jgi:hypothetical protein